MGNAYTVGPSNLLGNISIGGTLTVAGGIVQGVTPNILRIGKFLDQVAGGIGVNVAFDGLTRDDITKQAGVLTPYGQSITSPDSRLSTSGVRRSIPHQVMMGNDGTVRVNTGNVTENTIYTRTIHGGIMGTMGGFCLELVHQLTVNTAGGANLRVYLGGTLIFTALLNAVATDIYRIYAIQQASNVNCGFYGTRTRSDGTVGFVSGSSAVDSAGDRDLVVTIQNVTGSNSSQIDLFKITDHFGDGQI